MNTIKRTDGVSVQAERTGVVGDGIPVWVDQDRSGGEFVEELSDDGFHSGGEHELDALFEQGVDGAEAGRHVCDEHAVVANAPIRERSCLAFSGIGIWVRAATMSAIGLTS